MRVVLDTNVFISGIFWEGNYCSQIIDLWKNKEFILLTSFPIIKELINSLGSFKVSISEEMTKEWIEMIIKNAIILEPEMKLNVVKKDSDDNKFIETAVTGNANYIISQDNNLLNIGKYQDIRILTPKQFLDKIRG
ncbi:MAG: putative toxin-antitoxin system toxin component, PIN family [Nanoarchaeota archaeon]|nr:putative toxin-antitoxin system toxin component, PIN family [Nanoarchaeota archaeon]